MANPDLAEPIRTALINASFTLLPTYKGALTIFTRRPVPSDAPYPMVVISPDISQTSNDGLNDQQPVVRRDVTVYGQNDTSVKYRVVEDLAYQIQDYFHRQRQTLTVSTWHVVGITAGGPNIAPTDDDNIVARVIPLMISLAKKAQYGP